MAASTITRGTFVDGTTPWDSSNISALIYDRIDQMFGGVGGYATLELGGALKINGALTQLSNDGGALGTASLGWSDLFLASGAVINFNNGDVTLTHSTNALAFAGASSGYAFQSGLLSSAEGLAIGSTKRFYFDGVAGTGNTYQEESAADVYQLVVGGTTKLRAAQTGISVSTSATTILADAGGLGSFVVVNGNDGSNRFCDLVLASTATAPTVVSSYTSLGSPAARTYTRSSDALQLAMASGTYSVHTVKFGS
jgi:hypothetical protein